MARGLPRETENDLDHWEILLEFLPAVLCQHFPIVLKDFAIVYYVTMAPYNSKSMFAWHALLAYFQEAPGLFIRFIRARTVIDQFSYLP